MLVRISVRGVVWNCETSQILNNSKSRELPEPQAKETTNIATREMILSNAK